jgi:hypothetical protein
MSSLTLVPFVFAVHRKFHASSVSRYFVNRALKYFTLKAERESIIMKLLWRLAPHLRMKPVIVRYALGEFQPMSAQMNVVSLGATRYTINIIVFFLL